MDKRIHINLPIPADTMSNLDQTCQQQNIPRTTLINLILRDYYKKRTPSSVSDNTPDNQKDAAHPIKISYNASTREHIIAFDDTMIIIYRKA